MDAAQENLIEIQAIPPPETFITAAERTAPHVARPRKVIVSTSVTKWRHVTVEWEGSYVC